jgi:hypothetical protein
MFNDEDSLFKKNKNKIKLFVQVFFFFIESLISNDFYCTLMPTRLYHNLIGRTDKYYKLTFIRYFMVLRSTAICHQHSRINWIKITTIMTN